ncbi:hypothetical protein BJV77DRAFT_1047487, partial [Russula vinacea]
RTGPASLGIDTQAHLTASPAFGTAEIHGGKDRLSEREDGSSLAPTPTTETQAASEAQQAQARREARSDRSPEVRMIGDFDDSANALWTLYGKEAKSHDQSRIQTLKDDMDGVLIFAGLFSATLTSFLIDTKQNLQASPADQTVYYLQQNVAMLNQISRQLSSLAPQVIIPSDPPSPFPSFKPLSSAIRVNAFWFIALVFSLSAALLAILVQQWVRGYMHVFQRYSHPLKSARLRQYLHDGSHGWLGDFVLDINTAVGINTLIPITLCGLIYVFTMLAPVIYPQSPYQNTFSALIWYLTQKMHGRRYKDRASSGVLKSVSSNMADGQMQLAMEETEKRKGRDERAIRWLVSNLTEDAEMESFAMAIPGSFHTEWGIEVWKRVAEAKGDEHSNKDSDWNHQRRDHSRLTIHSLLNPITRLARIRTAKGLPADVETHQMALYPSHIRSTSAHTRTLGENVLYELSSRVARLLETCNNHGLFANEESWRRRTRAGVETAASLVFYANAEPAWFGDICKLLSEIGDLFVMPIRRTLNDEWLTMHATWAVMSFALLQSDYGTVDERALRNVQKIDESFGKSWKCLRELYVALFYPRGTNPTEEQVKEILCNHKYQIAELERIKLEADRMQDVNISDLQHGMDRVTHKLTGQLPGVQFDVPPLELFSASVKPQLILPRQRLQSLCSIGPKLRDITEGRNSEPCSPGKVPTRPKLAGHLMERQLWRLHDLRHGSGLGFTVEVFFLALRQLLSISSSKEPYIALFIGTFRAIISDWEKYKPRHLLRLRLSVLHYRRAPRVLGNMLEGEKGSHIDKAVRELRAARCGFMASARIPG